MIFPKKSIPHLEHSSGVLPTYSNSHTYRGNPAVLQLFFSKLSIAKHSSLCLFSLLSSSSAHLTCSVILFCQCTFPSKILLWICLLLEAFPPSVYFLIPLDCKIWHVCIISLWLEVHGLPSSMRGRWWWWTDFYSRLK